jgi:hypothetical protein
MKYILFYFILILLELLFLLLFAELSSSLVHSQYIIQFSIFLSVYSIFKNLDLFFIFIFKGPDDIFFKTANIIKAHSLTRSKGVAKRNIRITNRHSIKTKN